MASGPLQRNSAAVAGSNHTLASLPVELLFSVVEALPTEQDVISLCRVNRRMRSVVLETGRLYRHYNSLSAQPYLFLRSLVEGGFGPKLRTMRMTYGAGVHQDRTRYYPSQSDKQVLANALRALGIADWERWATACNDPNVYHQFLYGVILMHAPNIESLEIDDGELSHRLPTWLDVVKRSVQGDFSHLRLFEKLNSITIDLRHLRPLWHLAHVFRLPALETLNISGVVGLPFVIEMNPDHPTYELGGFMSEWGVRIDPRSSSVEKLSIHDSFVDTRILCKMMDSCRNLKSFMYQHSLEPYMYQVERDILGDYDVEGDGQFMADYAMLGDALRRQSQSLEYLDIEDLDRPAYGTAELGSLATLSKLKYFKGPLLGRPYNDAAPFFLELPRELETLSFPIRNQGELEVDKFMSAWHRIPSTFPNLRELRIPVTDSFILHNFRIRKAQMQEISPTLSRIQFSASKQDTIYRGEAIFYFDHIAT